MGDMADNAREQEERWQDDDDMLGEDDVYDSDTRKFEWEDRDHNVHLIRDLDTRHLRAIVKRFSQHHHPSLFWFQDWKYTYLKRELESRK